MTYPSGPRIEFGEVSRRTNGAQITVPTSVPLLLADIDGTLIASPGRIGREVRELLVLLSRHGGWMVPVSARPLGDIARMFRHHGEVHLAAGSGGGVLGTISSGRIHEVVYEELMAEPVAAAALDMASDVQRRLGGVVFIFRSSADDFEVLTMGDIAGLDTGMVTKIAGARRVRGATVPLRGPVDALGVSILSRASPAAMRRWTKCMSADAGFRYAVYPEVRSPGWCWWETFPATASKGNAAELITRRFATSSRAVLVTAVGDGCQDLGMLRAADQSYCPATADAAVKAETVVLPACGGPEFVSLLTGTLRAQLDAE